MLPAPTPANEGERIASLRRMLLLSTPDEEAFDRITRIAQRLFNAPIVLISLIDTDRQWFKSCIGLPVRQTGRDVSFCGHAILGNELFVIEDARQDPRFADNPLVVGAPRVIFYAGRPLRNAEGHAVGTLCVIDNDARSFSAIDRRAVDGLGYWVEAVFQQRDLCDTQMEVVSELEEAQRDALLDPMLNVWTRAAALDICQREVRRAYDGKRPLAVAIIAITNLEAIRAQYGVEAYREALIEGAKCLRTLQRSYDSLGRLDESEFIVVMPDADQARARANTERIEQGMDFPFLVGEEIIELKLRTGIAFADFVSFTPQASELVDLARADLETLCRQGE